MSERKKFYLSKNAKTGIYYAEFTNPQTGARLRRSTGVKNRDEAAAVVGKWLTEGLPTKGKINNTLNEILDFNELFSIIKKAQLDENQILEICKYWRSTGRISFNITTSEIYNQNLIEYLFNFYDYDNSLYFLDKRAHGKNISKQHCINAKRKIKKYIKEYFDNKKIAEISRNDLKEFGISLKESLSGKTVNNIMHYLTTPLRWAFNEKKLPEDITAKLGGYSGGEKKRGTFSDNEIENLSEYKYWESRMAYIAFLLSATSGLRVGEIRALRRKDIGNKILYIRHSYNFVDKLKDTKNHEERRAILNPLVKELLFELLKSNPTDKSDDQFIFYSSINPEVPCGGYYFSKYLHMAIKKAEIDTTNRNICFHSLRHYCGTLFFNKTGDLRLTSKIMGHKDLSQTANYADHIQESEMAELSDRAANIIQFPRVKGA